MKRGYAKKTTKGKEIKFLEKVRMNKEEPTVSHLRPPSDD